MNKKAIKWLVIAGAVLALADVLMEPSPAMFVCSASGVIGLVVIARFAPVLWKRGILALKVPVGPVVVILSICFYAAIAEAVLRIFYFQSFPDVYGKSYLGYRYDAKLGWFPVANSTLLWANDQHFTLAHNSQGFRGPELVRNGKPNIIFAGDSFVWGFNVDTADRFTEKFQTKHPNWNVYNFGVSGYGTDQEFLLLQEHWEQYKPRFVFLVICVENDHVDNSTNLREDYFKPYYTTTAGGLKLQGVPVPRSERAFCSDHPALSRVHLLRLVMRVYYRFTHPPKLLNRDPTQALLSAMRNYVHAKGASFAVGLTDRDTELEQFLDEAKIPFVDLSTSLRFGPRDHWTPRGHTVVCEKIDEFLRARKFVE